MQELKDNVQQQLALFGAKEELYRSLEARFQDYKESDLVERQARLHFTIELLKRGADYISTKWLAEMVLYIQYAHYLSDIKEKNPAFLGSLEKQLVSQTNVYWSDWSHKKAAVYIQKLGKPLFSLDLRHLDDADLQGNCSIKKVIVRALLAKFIFDQKLYDENDVILADDEVVQDIALKFSGEYGFHARLSPENIARWQDRDLRKAKLQYELDCLSSVSSRAELDNILSLLNTLQDIIITQFKTGRHQERCLIGASQFLAEILLEFFNQKCIKDDHNQAVVTQEFYREPFLDEVYDLISVEELVSAGEAYPIFHVIIQDGILDILQNQLRKMYAKYQYQTDEQLNAPLDPGIYSKPDELMSFLLRYRAKSALLQPNLIEPILSSPDIKTACETMIKSIRALTRPVNTAFYQHTKAAIQLALSTHDVDPRVKQQIEDLVQSFIDTIETSADPKIDLIRSYKQQIARVFTHESWMSLLKYIVLISLATLMITLATMALSLTIPLWTLNGFMVAVLHPYIYGPAALAVTMAGAWKANSIFKHNEKIREAVVRPLWKLEECMALSLN